MQRLVNVIQRYAWGSVTALPQLLGVPPDGQPQAELWLGAHPSAPSQTATGRRLDALIAEAPQRLLGAATVERFGPQLPFLLKVLAAARPLSLQAHPSLLQAQAGFAREEAAGIPRTAGHRNYKDENHKPEIICALTPFRALCGFRRVSETAQLLRALGLDATTLESAGLRAYLEQVMTLPKGAQANLVAGAAGRATRPVPGFEAECSLAVHLAAAYPGDVGVIGALLLNLVTLAPGEALFLGAGNLHAYLEGTGIELMANSDNVLRGGLTPKHVDVPELLSVLRLDDGPAVKLSPRGAPEGVYETPAPDFRLSRVAVEGEVRLAARGPQVLLVVEGEVAVSASRHPQGEEGGLRLERGASVFIGADEGDVTMAGSGVVFRATPGDG